MGIALVLLIRLTVPLAVLRWPFWGAITAIVADAVDIIVFQLTDVPDIGYHRVDKALDVFYLSLFAIVAQRWPRDSRIVASGLFAFRMIGTAAYEGTGDRVLLFAFPNIFEFYFLLVAGFYEFRPSYEMTFRRSAIWIAALAIPKMVQEYALHYAKWLDQWRAVDIIEDAAKETIEFVTPWRR